MGSENRCLICGKAKEKEWHILCRSCFQKMLDGKIVGVKYEEGKWKVHTRKGWVNLEKGDQLEPDHVYQGKNFLVTENEARFLPIIHSALSILYGEKSYNVFPQVALSSLVQKETSIPWRNELFRSVDFLITNLNYEPLYVIEINDSTHNDPERIQRDTDLKAICEEAGIPVVFLNGCKEATVISAEELCTQLRTALWDISNLKSQTYLYRIHRPEIESKMLLDSPQAIPMKKELGVETESAPAAQVNQFPRITSKNGSVSKRKKGKKSSAVVHNYREQFLYSLAMGLGGYVLGIVFCLVFFTHNTLGELLYDAVFFAGIPFGWIALGEFLPDSILLRGMIGILFGSIAYPFLLIYYFIRMILEILIDHKNRKASKRG